MINYITIFKSRRVSPIIPLIFADDIVPTHERISVTQRYTHWKSAKNGGDWFWDL